MTNEEAIKVLSSWAECKYKPTHNAACLAIAALRAQAEAEKNDPLTLDELREMDGEPVWIVEYPDWGHWELSEDAEDYLADRDSDFYGMKHDDPCGKYGLHSLGWLAYRQRPKEGTI